jgi:hypothetical protein
MSNPTAEMVTDAELAADLYRYRNNKAGTIYRALTELQQRRSQSAGCSVCGSQVERGSQHCARHLNTFTDAS